MKAKIGTSFGLALMLAIGVIAAMLALGMFSPYTVKANPGAITIASGKVTNTPTEPGEVTTFTISFRNPTELVAGSGQIFVLFDKNIGVPSSIEKERITISASGGGVSNPVFDPTVDSDVNGDTVITITVGDTSSTAGTQNLAAYDAPCNGHQHTCGQTTNTNSGHVIKFSALAGLTNATTPTTDSTSWVKMSDDGATYGSSRTIQVDRWLKLSSTSGAKGKVLTLTGKAFTSGSHAEIFLDADSNGQRASTETLLGQSDAAISSGAFTATITVGTDFAVGSNTINAIDGRRTTGSYTAGTESAYPRKIGQKFTLKGSISVVPTSAVRGETVTVTLTDYGKSPGADGTVTQIRFGGVQSDLSGITRTYTSNSGDFTITVPATAPLGDQVVDVVDTLEDTSAPGVKANITIAALDLSVSPASAVANQKVTVDGSGFVGDGTVTADTITVGGVTVDHSAITIDDSGNLITTFRLPTGDGTAAGKDADGVLRTPGEHEIKITDSDNRIGTVKVTVPARTVTLDTSSSRRGSTVTATGTGFVASKTVNLLYKCKTTETTVATVTANADGNFDTTFLVPSDADIPCSSVVTAQVGDPSSGAQRTATASHSVPGANIAVDPASAASGANITISGSDFPGYGAVTTLTIGGVSALPVPAPATIEDGSFSASALVPALSLGTQTVVVTVGTTSANLPITIVEAAAAVVEPVAPATALADMVTAETLDVVWYFSSVTKEWLFYDPDPDFTAFNDLLELDDGDIYDIKVTEDTTVTLNGTSRTLTCVGGNCWNRLVW